MSIDLLHEPWEGTLRYFGSDRFFPTESFKDFNGGKIDCTEIVSFDCCLMNMYEMESQDAVPRPDTQQIVAVVFRPEVCPDPFERLERDGFMFCGYDLVEDGTSISAITNCGGEFTSIPYDKLTEFGLLPTYKDAVLAQLALVEEAPEEHHAYCMIYEIWRKLV